MHDMTKQPMRIELRGTTPIEAMTLIPVLRTFVLIQIQRGADREAFLFERGIYAGPASARRRLQALLVQNAPTEVKLVSHDVLARLYGSTVSSVQLVIEPEGTLGP